MALSMQEKRHVGREIALRYLRARKKEKGIMLREFCATTGYSPPYAAFLLRTHAKRVIVGGVTPGTDRITFRTTFNQVAQLNTDGSVKYGERAFFDDQGHRLAGIQQRH